MPIAFRELLPANVWKAITELSLFFKSLTSTVITNEDMARLESDIPIILCKLERIFPPSFFDSMEHLPVHLPYEARIAGPVQFRWMYPFERYLRKLKLNIRNKAHVESSICNAYLVEEASTFCSYYFEDHVQTKARTVPRNYEGGGDYIPSDDPLNLSIFKYSGRPLGRSKTRHMTQQEYKAAHSYILLNCEEVEPYVRIYTQMLQHLNPNITNTEIDAKLEMDFAIWFKTYAEDPNSGIHNNFIQDLVKGPLETVRIYNGYFVSGYKFHTVGYGASKMSINSGVCIKGQNYSHNANDWYGQLREVVEVEYLNWPIKRTALFMCDWFDPTPNMGIRVHDQYNIVEINHRRRYDKYEPFVLAMQAAQVYFCSYPSLQKDKVDWWVVSKIKPRGVVVMPRSFSKTTNVQEPPAFQEELIEIHNIEITEEDQQRTLNDPIGDPEDIMEEEEEEEGGGGGEEEEELQTESSSNSEDELDLNDMNETDS